MANISKWFGKWSWNLNFKSHHYRIRFRYRYSNFLWFLWQEKKSCYASLVLKISIFPISILFSFSLISIVTTIQYTIFSLTPWLFLMWLWLGLRGKISFLTKKNSMKRTLTLAQYEEAIDANFVLVLIGKRDIPQKNT